MTCGRLLNSYCLSSFSASSFSFGESHFHFVFFFGALNHPFRLCVSNYIDEIFLRKYAACGLRGSKGMDGNRLRTEFTCFRPSSRLFWDFPSNCANLFWRSFRRQSLDAPVAHQSILILVLRLVFIWQTKIFSVAVKHKFAYFSGQLWCGASCVRRLYWIHRRFSISLLVNNLSACKCCV